jgi:hypothetical protein
MHAESLEDLYWGNEGVAGLCGRLVSGDERIAGLCGRIVSGNERVAGLCEDLYPVMNVSQVSVKTCIR